MCKKRIAVSNYELYRGSRREKHVGQSVELHEEKYVEECRTSSGRIIIEEYTDFLAGIAAGDERCLGQRERPDILIVREKQLTESEYLALFTRLWEKSNVPKHGHALLIPHTYPAAAKQTGCGWIHLSLSLLQKYRESGVLSGLRIGTSVHSVEEAELAQKLGAAYVTAGHVFATDCKKGAGPRGLAFLEAVCTAVRIPVYAIGGIHEKQLPLIWESSAAGACMMSEYMSMMEK